MTHTHPRLLAECLEALHEQLQVALLLGLLHSNLLLQEADLGGRELQLPLLLNSAQQRTGQRENKREDNATGGTATI